MTLIILLANLDFVKGIITNYSCLRSNFKMLLLTAKYCKCFFCVFLVKGVLLVSWVSRSLVLCQAHYTGSFTF